MLRNPSAPGWTPQAKDGEATESEEVAREWVTDYLRAWRERQAARQLGVTPEGARRRLRASVDEYLDHRDAVDGVAVATAYNDRSVLSMLVDWCGSEADPGAITAEELQRHFHARLRAGYARSTCSTQKSILSHFFAWLKVEPNPARGVKLKREKRVKKYGWSNEQIEALRAAADRIDRGEAREPHPSFDVSARFAFELALGTGLREGELFAAEARLFDERTHTCRVLRQASRYHTGALVDTKGRDSRSALVLPDYWPWHPKGARGFLLSHPDGRVIYQGKNRAVLDHVIREAGLKMDGERNHMTRHTYCRICLEEYGVDLRDLQAFLGHKSSRTTEQYYGHYAPSVAVARAATKVYGAPSPERALRPA